MIRWYSVILPGYFGRRFPDPAPCPAESDDGVFLKNVSPKIIEDEMAGIDQKIMNEIDNKQIEKFLKWVTCTYI